jgi:hypothetical protein
MVEETIDSLSNFATNNYVVGVKDELQESINDVEERLKNLMLIVKGVLEEKINEVELTPGPRGEQGPQGVIGPRGE